MAARAAPGFERIRHRREHAVEARERARQRVLVARVDAAAPRATAGRASAFTRSAARRASASSRSRKTTSDAVTVAHEVVARRRSPASPRRALRTKGLGHGVDRVRSASLMKVYLASPRGSAPASSARSRSSSARSSGSGRQSTSARKSSTTSTSSATCGAAARSSSTSSARSRAKRRDRLFGPRRRARGPGGRAGARPLRDRRDVPARRRRCTSRPCATAARATRSS